MRSQFLTILCILTFISCGWGIFDATVSLAETRSVARTTRIDRAKPADAAEKKEDRYFEDRSSGDVPLPANQNQVRQLAVAQIVYSLITLVGAILMFRLRRVGFWIYVAGVVAGLVLPVILAGFGALNTSFGAFFSVIFAGLYWITLKEINAG